MKDLGVAGVIPGTKITQTSDRLVMSQSYYVKKILSKFYKGDNGYKCSSI
jgi:hypothetical protein